MSDNGVRCIRCIVPASLPSAKLDKNGICSFCRRFDALFGNDDGQTAKRISEFEKISGKSQEAEEALRLSDPVERRERQHPCPISLRQGL